MHKPSHSQVAYVQSTCIVLVPTRDNLFHLCYVLPFLSVPPRPNLCCRDATRSHRQLPLNRPTCIQRGGSKGLLCPELQLREEKPQALALLSSSPGLHAATILPQTPLNNASGLFLRRLASWYRRKVQEMGAHCTLPRGPAARCCRLIFWFCIYSRKMMKS